VEFSNCCCSRRRRSRIARLSSRSACLAHEARRPRARQRRSRLPGSCIGGCHLGAVRRRRDLLRESSSPVPCWARSDTIYALPAARVGRPLASSSIRSRRCAHALVHASAAATSALYSLALILSSTVRVGLVSPRSTCESITARSRLAIVELAQRDPVPRQRLQARADNASGRPRRARARRERRNGVRLDCRCHTRGRLISDNDSGRTRPASYSSITSRLSGGTSRPLPTRPLFRSP